jgi:hypothetical protein
MSVSEAALAPEPTPRKRVPSLAQLVASRNPEVSDRRNASRWAAFEEDSRELFRAISQEDPAQVERVFEGCARVELDPDFLGFVGLYKRLAEMIPLHWGVVDLGCAYAPQAWYFREHAFYVGVDHSDSCEFGPFVRFAFGNTQHVVGSIEEYLDALPRFEVPVFAIASYVPAQPETMRRVRETFQDLFVFYPKSRV